MLIKCRGKLDQANSHVDKGFMEMQEKLSYASVPRCAFRIKRPLGHRVRSDPGHLVPFFNLTSLHPTRQCLFLIKVHFDPKRP